MTTHPVTTPGDARSPAPRRLAALVCGLVFVAAVAQTAIVPLLPRLAEVDGLSTATRALLPAAPGLATLAVSAPAGLVADRGGPPLAPRRPAPERARGRSGYGAPHGPQRRPCRRSARPRLHRAPRRGHVRRLGGRHAGGAGDGPRLAGAGLAAAPLG